MNFKHVSQDVWHGCWTFMKATYASLATGGPVGYYDPRVNTRVATALSLLPDEEASAFHGSPDLASIPACDGEWEINPATGLMIAPGFYCDLGGNPLGWNRSWEDD